MRGGIVFLFLFLFLLPFFLSFFNFISQEHATALHWAAGGNAAECARLLVDRGADASIRNDVGQEGNRFIGITICNRS